MTEIFFYILQSECDKSVRRTLVVEVQDTPPRSKMMFFIPRIDQLVVLKYSNRDQLFRYQSKRCLLYIPGIAADV